MSLYLRSFVNKCSQVSGIIGLYASNSLYGIRAYDLYARFSLNKPKNTNPKHDPSHAVVTIALLRRHRTLAS